jgi:hypothetical protein
VRLGRTSLNSTVVNVPQVLTVLRWEEVMGMKLWVNIEPAAIPVFARSSITNGSYFAFTAGSLDNRSIRRSFPDWCCKPGEAQLTPVNAPPPLPAALSAPGKE